MQVFGGLAYCRSKSEVADLLGDVGTGSEFAQPALDDIGSAERLSVGLACNAGPGQCCSLKTVEQCLAIALCQILRMQGTDLPELLL
jgi:hypothetical protein